MTKDYADKTWLRPDNLDQLIPADLAVFLMCCFFVLGYVLAKTEGL